MMKLVEQLHTYGRLAKKTQCKKERFGIILKMSDICWQLRDIEPEFKAVFPYLDTLYDRLIYMRGE